MALEKKANTWYAYFRDIDGRRVKRSLHTGDRAIAEIREKAMRERIKEVKFLAMIQSMRPDEPQITTAFPKKQAPAPGEHQRGSIALDKMWDLALTRRELSATHQKHWKSFISRVGKKYADEITPQVALAYLEKHYNKGNGKTFNNVKSNLNTVFRMCLVEAGLSESPFAPIANRRVTDVEHHRNLTDEEIAKIMAAPQTPGYIRIMTMLSRWTTQRLETCARMTPEMFDFDKKVFLIDPGKNARFKEWVCCPIFPELEEYIKPILELCASPKKPIVQYFNYPKKNDYFSAEFRELLISLGIRDDDSGKASFHSLRGSAITWLKENGVDRETRRSITGHDSQDIEDVYAKDVATISRLAKGWKKQ